MGGRTRGEEGKSRGKVKEKEGEKRWRDGFSPPKTFAVGLVVTPMKQTQ